LDGNYFLDARQRFERNKTMKQIQLTQNKVAIVDDEDFEWLNQWKWSAYKSHNIWYAIRSELTTNKNRTIIRMHREILGLKLGDKLESDHINHNGLDNRRCNLRICNRFQNQHNRQPQKNCSSSYKGVYWNKEYRKWQIQIQVNGKRKNLGRFNSEIEAARVYDEAARGYYGEFAFTNFKRKGDICLAI